MTDSQIALSFDIEGRAPWPKGEAPPMGLSAVTLGYFGAMGIPVLRGRDFSLLDAKDGRHVVIVSQRTVEKFFPGEEPIGRRIAFGTDRDGKPEWAEIVGIVGDVRRHSLGEAPDPVAYLPFAQAPLQSPTDHGSLFFVAKTRSPQAVLAALPSLVQRIDPEMAIISLKTMEARVDATAGEEQRTATVLGGFALAALVLATLGLFGLVSYTTTERTRELGIRLALGSSPEAVVRLVLKGGMRLVAVGLAAGVVLGAVVLQQVAALVPNVSAFEAGVVAPIPIVLGLAGVLACLLPALRAVRTPPASALRYE
jgi:hypothetical protein